MNVLLLGSGGREHALGAKIASSKSCSKLYTIPGNPGIAQIAICENIDLKDHDNILNYCKSNEIELVVVGPEQPLADGIADYLESNGLAVFGPKKIAAQLESSKAFSKNIMINAGIPTASYKEFDISQKETAKEYVKNHNLPVVIKADGLAAGKGVIIAQSNDEAMQAVDNIFAGEFGSAGDKIVVEQFLVGQELSIFAICDGDDFVLLPAAQDHKRIGDGDTGLNTGGMGAYCPISIATDDVYNQVATKVVNPLLSAMKSIEPFKGCLFCGLMLVDDLVYVIEFNVRFGDPETQVVLENIDGDFLKLLHSSAIGKLDQESIKYINNNFSVNVVLASKGYPQSFEKGFELSGLDNAIKNGAKIFHAGTKLDNGKLLSAGGRVLSVVYSDNTLQSAIKKCYKWVNMICYDNIYYRKDIGQKGL